LSFSKQRARVLAVSDDHNTQVRLYDESRSLVGNVLLKLVYFCLFAAAHKTKKKNQQRVACIRGGELRFRVLARGALVLMASTR
jgi:hypothetical protein